MKGSMWKWRSPGPLACEAAALIGAPCFDELVVECCHERCADGRTVYLWTVNGRLVSERDAELVFYLSQADPPVNGIGPEPKQIAVEAAKRALVIRRMLNDALATAGGVRD